MIPNFFANQKSNFKSILIDSNYFQGREIKMLQLGAWAGHASEWLCNNINGHLTDVDAWAGSVAGPNNEKSLSIIQDIDIAEAEKEYYERTGGLPVTTFKGTTNEFFEQNTEKFDFIYVDASHIREDVEMDGENALKVLNPGGLIVFDDFLWYYGKDIDLVPYGAVLDILKNHYSEIKPLMMNYQAWIQKL